MLIVFICVAQSWSSVEGKNRNRVQKWQQRTWKARFGNVPRNVWKFNDGLVKGSSKSHRGEKSYASATFGELSRKEIEMLSGKEVPNRYSNYRFYFEDPGALSYAKVRSSVHRSDKSAKSVRSNPKTVQNFRMKRFAFQNEDDDSEPEHFSNDLSKNPFVFGSDHQHDNEYPEERSEDLSNDLADLDFVRDDETIDFVPLRAGSNQRYSTVEEDDPFPHAAPPPARKNVTRKVQYTLVIHHGDKVRDGDGELSDAASNWRTKANWRCWELLWVAPVLFLWKGM